MLFVLRTATVLTLENNRRQPDRVLLSRGVISRWGKGAEKSRTKTVKPADEVWVIGDRRKDRALRAKDMSEMASRDPFEKRMFRRR